MIKTKFLNAFDTYINQIFGDESIRNIWCQVYPNPKYKLEVENVVFPNDYFEIQDNGIHHYVINVETSEKIFKQ